MSKNFIILSAKLRKYEIDLETSYGSSISSVRTSEESYIEDGDYSCIVTSSERGL